jgi:2-dehydro-3-deoxyphosphogluconate aldolase/(4S)-4-hydroxy-2-oxoglutarate aldolase
LSIEKLLGKGKKIVSIDFESIIKRLKNIGIVPVIKLENTSLACPLAEALLKGGIACAEITFRAEGADKVIKDISKNYPDMLIGAGTVLSVEQADRAIDAGAKFLVAPGLNPNVVKHSLNKGIPFIPGISSASEIELAFTLGLTYVKFFPAEQAGGLAYIKAISAPYGNISFMPTGGINENNISEYLLFEKVFACGGTWMVNPKLLEAQDFDAITAICKLAIDKILGFEFAHVGINCDSENDALGVTNSLSNAFSFESKIGNSSIFCSDKIEVMKSPYLGKHGHLAIKTNSIDRALYHLKNKGFEADESTKKTDAKGNVVAIYLKDDIGGFAVHLLQKR